jgi:hypothetical protein
VIPFTSFHNLSNESEKWGGAACGLFFTHFEVGIIEKFHFLFRERVHNLIYAES